MTEILELAKSRLQKVKTSGNENIMAICPFHRKADGREERNGSFAMNIYNGLWHCHSCHASGNLYTFLRDMGVSRADIDLTYKSVLVEAERHAPVKADPLSPVDPVDAATEPLEERLLGLFHQCPQMLLDEGFPEDLLQNFDVGFDQKHQRITFPLRDLQGRLVGISGRTITGATPRYKVYDHEYTAFGMASRRTEKRALLWNAHTTLARLAFEANPDERRVIVTEGFKAVMRVAQAGIQTVVGLLGSRLSQEQLWALSSMGCPIFLMLDTNEAGYLGQVDAAKRLGQVTPFVRVVTYHADQPSDLTPDEILDAVHAATPAAQWLGTQYTLYP